MNSHYRPFYRFKKMANRIWPLLAVVFFAGCAEEPPRDYFIGDRAFTAEERVAIESGAAWIAFQTGTAPIEIRWESLPADGQAPFRTISRGDLPKNTLGSTVDTHLVVDVWQAEDRLIATAAHELGHALGLSHHDGSGIMNPRVPAMPIWSDADRNGCITDHICK